MFRAVKPLFALAVAVYVLAGSAFAAEEPPIATASPVAPPPISLPGVAVPDPTAEQIDAWLKADGSSVKPLDPNAVDPLAVGPRTIHGEVGATVSNRGYSAYGAASMPLGQASELDVAVAGGHVTYPHGGSANPKSLAVGLYLDGRDVDNWISRKHCGAPRWGVSLKDDPQVQPDGSCKTTERQAAQDAGPRSHHRGAWTPGDGYPKLMSDQAGSALGGTSVQSISPGPAPTP